MAIYPSPLKLPLGGQGVRPMSVVRDSANSPQPTTWQLQKRRVYKSQLI
ncbi:hypothetical protein [Candidatus Regiella insecticola]